MDIDRNAIALRETEHDVEMPLRIAIDRGWVEPAHNLRAELKCLLHQFDGAGPNEHPALRKGDELDIDDIPIALPRFENALDACDADFRVHVHMGPDMRRAEGGGEHGLSGGLTGRVDPEHPPLHPLVLDLVDETRADLVAIPAHAEERLVHMRMGFDETGDQNGAAAVQGLRAVLDLLAIAGNAPFADCHRGRLATHRAYVADHKTMHRCSRFSGLIRRGRSMRDCRSAKFVYIYAYIVPVKSALPDQ